MQESSIIISDITCMKEKFFIAGFDIFERTKSVDRLNSMVSQSQYAHCRIGLARKFLIQENHCYLMLNGLFLY